MIQDLVSGGIIRRVDGEANSYVPAATEVEIKPAEIVELIFGKEVPLLSSGSLATEVLDAARKSLVDKKILSPAGPSPQTEA